MGNRTWVARMVAQWFTHWFKAQEMGFHWKYKQFHYRGKQTTSADSNNSNANNHWNMRKLIKESKQKNCTLVILSPGSVLLKKLDGPFLWMGFKFLKAKKLLRRDSFLFTLKSPGVSDSHLIDLRRMESWVDFGATQWFWTQNS